jgi:hypothetical protein
VGICIVCTFVRAAVEADSDTHGESRDRTGKYAPEFTSDVHSSQGGVPFGTSVSVKTSGKTDISGTLTTSFPGKNCGCGNVLAGAASTSTDKLSMSNKLLEITTGTSTVPWNSNFKTW